MEQRGSQGRLAACDSAGFTALCTQNSESKRSRRSAAEGNNGTRMQKDTTGGVRKQPEQLHKGESRTQQYFQPRYAPGVVRCQPGKAH